jgi:predicted membrane channel-forming protein YqfA (hemolysin III family)
MMVSLVYFCFFKGDEAIISFKRCLNFGSICVAIAKSKSTIYLFTFII